MSEQTADVEAALDAMAAAEHEARAQIGSYDPDDVEYGGWAADRLALIERDRATLQRHASEDYGISLQNLCCAPCRVHWPCPDAQAVIDYWTPADEEPRRAWDFAGEDTRYG